MIEQVNQALPCMCGFISAGIDRKRPPRGHAHWVSCPAEYRPVVTVLLAERDKRIAELEAKQEWISAEAKLPAYGQICLIAQDYDGSAGWTWLAYTGWLSESRPDGDVCWYVDDNDFLPLANTWWSAVAAPDGNKFNEPHARAALEKP